MQDWLHPVFHANIPAWQPPQSCGKRDGMEMDAAIIDCVAQPLAWRLGRKRVDVVALARACVRLSTVGFVVLLAANLLFIFIEASLPMAPVLVLGWLCALKVPYDLSRERDEIGRCHQQVLQAWMSGRPIPNPMRGRPMMRLGLFMVLTLLTVAYATSGSQVHHSGYLGSFMLLLCVSTLLGLAGLYLGACNPIEADGPGTGLPGHGLPQAG